jgi:hypothetical protein
VLVAFTVFYSAGAVIRSAGDDPQLLQPRVPRPAAVSPSAMPTGVVLPRVHKAIGAKYDPNLKPVRVIGAVYGPAERTERVQDIGLPFIFRWPEKYVLAANAESATEIHREVVSATSKLTQVPLAGRRVHHSGHGRGQRTRRSTRLHRLAQPQRQVPASADVARSQATPNSQQPPPPPQQRESVTAHRMHTAALRDEIHQEPPHRLHRHPVRINRQPRHDPIAGSYPAPPRQLNRPDIPLHHIEQTSSSLQPPEAEVSPTPTPTNPTPRRRVAS